MTHLELDNVSTWFPVRQGFFSRQPAGMLRAVDGVSLNLERGEAVGLVGESGCGKSTLARTIVQLVPPTHGEIRLDGIALNRLSRRELRRLRPRLQLVFQDPFASLNPRRTVFDALAEPMLTHGLVNRAGVARAVGELMEETGLARRFMRKYPHEFSGGQRQRIAVARALALRPELLLADEPVSALDVSVQSQILNLLRRLQRERNLTMLLIAHDLAVVRHMARRIAVMYLGRIVELGDGEAVFRHPLHPYTRALASAAPLPDPDIEKNRRRILLPGDPPSPVAPPPGCPFHPRCPCAAEKCACREPALEEHAPGRFAACLRVGEIPAAAMPDPAGADSVD
jgi:oligopeptide transport system ATP-binding protein